MIFVLLAERGDLARVRAAYPELAAAVGEGFLPDPRGLAPDRSDDAAVSAAVQEFSGIETERDGAYSFVAHPDRTAFAVLCHCVSCAGEEFRRSNVYIHAIHARTESALRDIVAYLRRFLDQTDDCCSGVLIDKKSLVWPSAEVSADAVRQHIYQNV
jgi:hypothetical protein